MTEWQSTHAETGGLLRIGIKLMMACATTNVGVYGLISASCISGSLMAFFCSDYVPLVNLIGVYFQIRDDLMNLQSTEVSHSLPSYDLLFLTPGRSV